MVDDGKTSGQVVNNSNLKDLVQIEVKDNGKGFVKGKSRKLHQTGLLGMEESVNYLGGKFEIQTAPGKGTVVKVSCPKVVYKVRI